MEVAVAVAGCLATELLGRRSVIFSRPALPAEAAPSRDPCNDAGAARAKQLNSAFHGSDDSFVSLFSGSSLKLSRAYC